MHAPFLISAAKLKTTIHPTLGLRACRWSSSLSSGWPTPWCWTSWEWSNSGSRTWWDGVSGSSAPRRTLTSWPPDWRSWGTCSKRRALRKVWCPEMTLEVVVISCFFNGSSLSAGSTFSSISTYLLDLPDYYEACNEYYQLKDRVKVRL